MCVFYFLQYRSLVLWIKSIHLRIHRNTSTYGPNVNKLSSSSELGPELLPERNWHTWNGYRNDTDPWKLTSRTLSLSHGICVSPELQFPTTATISYLVWQCVAVHRVTPHTTYLRSKSPKCSHKKNDYVTGLSLLFFFPRVQGISRNGFFSR